MPRNMRIILIFAALFSLLATQYSVAKSIREVPSGNRLSRQPAIPSGSKNRTVAKKTSFDRKYEKIKKLLEKDRNLQNRIKRVSKAYKIDPIHIVGALVGEHTFNVDVYDTFQSYYVKAIAYATNNFTFEYDGEKVMDFVNREEFAKCKDIKGSYALWSCRENVWQKKFRGKKVDGKRYPKDRFSAVFFQPFFAGQTFGLGQLNPLTALKLTDKVSSVSRHKKLNANKAKDVYKTIMDPNTTLSYMAALIRVSIDAYKKKAKLDISKNPGITATLYNLGNPEARAVRHARSGRRYPRENYYGWFVNKHEKELREIVKKW
jgi:hypothetical protein